MKKKPAAPTLKPHKPHHWAQCFLEHATREMKWAEQAAKDGQYQVASNALVRQGVWLHAALMAQEQGK